MARNYIPAANLLEWLRVSSKYLNDSHYRAAVDLLAAHNGGGMPLLHNEQFQRIAVKGTYRNGLWIDWAAARRAMRGASARLPTHGSEAGILRLACALGLDDFEITSLDTHNRPLLVEAMTQAITPKRPFTPYPRAVPDVSD